MLKLVGIEEIEQLSSELDIPKNEIIEILREETSKFYNAFWTIFTSNNTIILHYYNKELKKTTRKTIFIKKENFKQIIKNTTNELLKLVEKRANSTIKRMLNLKVLEGKYDVQRQLILLYDNGVQINNLYGKPIEKVNITHIVNKTLKYKLLGKTLFKDSNKKNIVYCIPLIKNLNKKKEKIVHDS